MLANLDPRILKFIVTKGPRVAGALQAAYQLLNKVTFGRASAVIAVFFTFLLWGVVWFLVRLITPWIAALFGVAASASTQGASGGHGAQPLVVEQAELNIEGAVVGAGGGQDGWD